VTSGCESPVHSVSGRGGAGHEGLLGSNPQSTAGGGGGGGGAGCGVGDGQVALASITEPSGHVCVGLGQVALASITEPSGHVCCGGLLSAGGGLLSADGHEGSFGVVLQSTVGGGLLSGDTGPWTGGGILACAIREPRAEVKSTNITNPDSRQQRLLFTRIISTLS
jgi:hypothetical protein